MSIASQLELGKQKRFWSSSKTGSDGLGSVRYETLSQTFHLADQIP